MNDFQNILSNRRRTKNKSQQHVKTADLEELSCTLPVVGMERAEEGGRRV